MNLKVIRYKNYGCTMTTLKDKNIYENNFFWSFYELNNGEIISLNFTENLNNAKVSSIDYHFSYTRHELKNGEVIEYKFSNAKPNSKEIFDEFFDYFYSIPPAKDIKELTYPSENEEKCVKEFFNKNILKNKEVSTNIIEQ